VWRILGPEFGEDTGKKVLIVQVLYGFKPAGAAFRSRISECMKHLGWKSCQVDIELWMKRQKFPDDGFK
jgi:hypothetical protein